MPYIGKSPSAGVRQRYQYTATAGQTTFSGTDLGNLTLTYTDNNFVDVFQNGVLLKGGGTDYTATSGTSVVLATGASVSDVIEIIVYDVFSVGNFFNRTDSDSRYALKEGGVVFNETSADVDFRVESDGSANMLFVDGGNNRIGINNGTPSDDVELTPSADGKGVTLKTTDNIRPYLNFDANRSSAGNNLAQINFKWNGTDVARIIGVAGSDTTNKDDGHITFQTASAGSTDERMRIDSNGHITKPSQPSFYVDKTDSQQSLPVNSDNTIIFDTERYDTASAFASNTFTAPVDGKYYLNTGLLLGNPPTDASYMECAIVTSNRRIGLLCDYDAFDQTTVYWAQNFSCVVDMDANDTAAVRIYQAGGAQNAFVFHNSASTYFCGILIG